MEKTSGSLSSTMNSVPPVSKEDANGGAVFGKHVTESVGKPAEYGEGDLKLKFFEGDHGANPAKFSTTMTGTAAKDDSK